MSSLEIAERTGKRHPDVKRDIRTMFAHLGEAGEQFCSTAWIDGPNHSRRNIGIYSLPKRECLILVSGYSVELRAAIIDRWQELEAQQAPRIPTHVEALRMARP
ncbi:hypothetical protein ASF20_04590 [Methylobacterium sp. Leaf88]|nr:hypothetical protein ASF20_04590 [Methylobacterium sp. Leaf88]